MKKLLLFVISCMMVIPVLAQEEHMKFMGIPINGKINNFKRQLEKKGLDFYAEVEHSYVFKGYFAGDASQIFVLFDNKTKDVYGVGVNIDCYSENIAKDIYWRYVHNLTYKYNAKYTSEIFDLYKENPEDLYKDIKMGKLKELNSVFTDSINNLTEIAISKVMVEDSDSVVLNSSLGMPYLYLKCMGGNLGSIKVKYKKKEDSYSYNDEYVVSIIYRDEKNVSKIQKEQQEDL